MFVFIRIANINSCVCYNMVQGRPTQLLDSQLGFNQHKTQSLNHTFKTRPTVLYSTKLLMLSVIATVLHYMYMWTVFSPTYIRYVGPTCLQYRIFFDVGLSRS